MPTLLTRTRPKIFLSASLPDRGLAAEVASTLTATGLDVLTAENFKPGEDIGDSVRDALRDSAATVFVLSRPSQHQQLPASILFEIGAASATDRPIYLIVDEPSYRLPFVVPRLRVFPANRADDVGRDIASRAD